MPLIDPTALRKICGKAPWEFLQCESCLTQALACRYDAHHQFSWAVVLSCPMRSIHASWTVCIECDSSRKRIYTKAQLTRHQRSFHGGELSKKRLYNSMTTGNDACDFAFKDDHIENNDTEFVDHPNHNCPLDESNTSLQFNFRREESARYFRHEKVKLGAASLVGYSCFEQDNIAHCLDPEEVNLQIVIAFLASTLSRGNRSRLSITFGKIVSQIALGHNTNVELNSLLSAEILDNQQIGSVMNLVHPISQSSPHPKCWSLSIPDNPPEMRRRVMEGKFSLIGNLPHPYVEMVGCHAYVSLSEIIADFLGHGTPYETVDSSHSSMMSVTRIGESSFAKSIISRAKELYSDNSGDSPSSVITILLNEWQDDFNILNSQKGGRGGASIWIKTVTIIPPHGHRDKSLRNTYPVAVGPKGVSHEEVELRFKEDLLSLSTGSKLRLYDGNSKTMQKVHVGLYVSISDQPERRGANYVMLGNSQFHARFGHRGDILFAKAIIPACQSCLCELLSSDPGRPVKSPDCPQCTCWETVGSPLLNYPPPINYPSDMVPPSGLLTPSRISYPDLIFSINNVHDNLVSCTWTITAAKAYLRERCLSQSAADNVIEHAINCHNLKVLYENKGTDPNGYLAICKERDLMPNMFQPWPIPSWWSRGVCLEQNIEATMHLLSGVTKTVVRHIQHWTACRGNKTSFLRYAKHILDGVQELQLPWCKCLPYTGGKLNGWVSENYFAFARVGQWFYSGLCTIGNDVAFQEPVDLPQSRWLKKHNIGWLQLRGLNVEGSAVDLKARVVEAMNKDGGPPPIRPHTGCPADVCMRLVISLCTMIGRLMAHSMDNSDINIVERCVKVFLSRFHESDKSTNSNTTPSWISSYNFVCLLNLPNILREYGPLRHMYEGGYQGEGYLRHAKPKLQHGLRKNWQANVLKNLLKTGAMEIVNSNATAGNENPYSRNWEVTDSYVYTGVGKVFHHFNKGSPLSIVRLVSGKYGCVLQDHTVLTVKLGRFVSSNNGLNYFQWSVNILDIEDTNVSPAMFMMHALLLPLLTCDGDGEYQTNGVYTLISSEWEVINMEGMISKPLLA